MLDLAITMTMPTQFPALRAELGAVVPGSPKEKAPYLRRQQHQQLDQTLHRVREDWERQFRDLNHHLRLRHLVDQLPVVVPTRATKGRDLEPPLDRKEASEMCRQSAGRFRRPHQHHRNNLAYYHGAVGPMVESACAGP